MNCLDDMIYLYYKQHGCLYVIEYKYYYTTKRVIWWWYMLHTIKIYQMNVNHHLWWLWWSEASEIWWWIHWSMISYSLRAKDLFYVNLHNLLVIMIIDSSEPFSTKGETLCTPVEVEFWNHCTKKNSRIGEPCVRNSSIICFPSTVPSSINARSEAFNIDQQPCQ